MSEQSPPHKPSVPGSVLNPFGIAAGMLLNDRAVLAPLFVILAIPALLDVFTSSMSSSARLGAVVLDKLSQILVVTFIVLRWRRRLQHGQGVTPRAGVVCARIGLLSIAASLVISTPVLGLVTLTNPAQALFFLFLGAVGALWCLRMYFYFAATGVLGLGVSGALANAARMSSERPSAALRSLITPSAVTLLLTALLTIPSPDGRSSFWIAVASSAEALFWILSTYTALAFALTLFHESDWRSAGLDPYRMERLRTLEAQGGKRLAKMLAPKFGALVALVALCFTVGNMIRQLHQPPAASVEVRRVEVSDYKVRVELSVADPEYKFRGFQPAAFSVASRTGFRMVDGLVSASLEPNKREIVGGVFANNGGVTTIYLEFSSSKTETVLRSLDNMWLWYKLIPLKPLQIVANPTDVSRDNIEGQV